MELKHEHCHAKHECLHVGLKIAKLLLKAAGVAAAFCLVKEVHRVHKAIEQEGHHHHEHIHK